MKSYIGLLKNLFLLIISLHITIVSGNHNACECYMLGTVGTIDGTSLCDNKTFQCKCYPNVIGKNCNQCQDGFYNILSGYGCSSCQCNPQGSVNKSCNAVTGQCQCKNGFTGFRCDRCEVNTYKFSSKRCDNCNCNPYGSKNLQCNIIGICPCIKNVEGKLCDHCKENTYNIKQGCIPCPPCYEFIQNEIKNYTKYLNTIKEALEEVENNLPLLIQDYKHFLNEIKLLKAKINKLKLEYEDADKMVLPEESINKLSKEAEDFHNEILDLIQQLDNKNKRKIMDALYTGRINLKEANNLVKLCEEALENATKTAKRLNRHNKTITVIARDAIKISQEIEDESEEFYQISLNVNFSCTEACNIAEEYHKELQMYNKELEAIKNDILNTTSGIEVIKAYSKKFHEVSKISNKKAFQLKEEADQLLDLTSEKIYKDLKDINSNLTLIDKEIKDLNDKAKLCEYKEEFVKNDLEKVENKQKMINDSVLLAQSYNERADVAINKAHHVFESTKESLKNLKKFKEIKEDAEDALKTIPEIRKKVDTVLNNSNEIQNIFHELSVIIQDLDKMKYNLSKVFENNESNLTKNINNFKILEEMEKEEKKISQKLAESHAKLKDIKANLKNLQKYQLEIERIIKRMQEYILLLNILPTSDEQLDEVEEEIEKMEEMVLTVEYLTNEKEKLQKEVENVKDIIESIPIEDPSLCESAKSEPKNK